jgi:hypothetical protein
VKDTTPPTITPCKPIVISIQPPNHKYYNFSISDLVSSVKDLGDLSVGIGNTLITSVSSDEPENSPGSGNTANDIVISSDAKSVQLRDEREGGGNGRVYTINSKVTDAFGNTARGFSQVWVPHDKGGNTAIDDGPAAGYTVNSSYYNE